jgi:hypothetical protein
MRYILTLAAALVLVGCRTDTTTMGTEAMDTATVTAPKPPPSPAKVENLAKGATVTVSSIQQEWEGEGPASSIIDGDATTRWSSAYADNQSATIDLGSPASLKRLVLLWEAAAPVSYDVTVSDDGKKWRTVAERRGGLEGPRTDTVTLENAAGRYVKLILNVRATEWGFSLYEAEVWGSR